jgi:hypothetical protein
MDVSTRPALAIPASAPVACVARKRPRRIPPQAGRALEILGHAIEYLTDEFVHQGGSHSAGDGQLKAVQLLMALNRQIYYECPEVPTLGERWRAWSHFHWVGSLLHRLRGLRSA